MREITHSLSDGQLENTHAEGGRYGRVHVCTWTAAVHSIKMKPVRGNFVN